MGDCLGTPGAVGFLKIIYFYLQILFSALILSYLQSVVQNNLLEIPDSRHSCSVMSKRELQFFMRRFGLKPKM
jgi:hypothetical protein